MIISIGSCIDERIISVKNGQKSFPREGLFSLIFYVKDKGNGERER
jgi:hypothetical protein